MRNFLRHFVLFALLIGSLLTTGVLATRYLARTYFDFSLPAGTTTLIVGDSHPGCAIIGDSLPGVYNLAHYGVGYFYNYVKARNFLERNPAVDTLVVGYGEHALKDDRNDWISGYDRITFKLRDHFFLLDRADYGYLLRQNPRAVVANTPRTIFQNLKMLARGKRQLGGFAGLTTHARPAAFPPLADTIRPLPVRLADQQLDNLLRIYELCQEREVQLVLLNTPYSPGDRNMLAGYRDTLRTLARERMPAALHTDHAALPLPDDGYADMSHLNVAGARWYTAYLRQHGFNDP